jgi:hypothetical protein
MSSVTYQWFSFGQMLLPLIVAAATSVFYFSVLEARLTKRLAVASHGILLGLAAAYAIAVSPWSMNRWEWFVPFCILVALSLVAVVYSLFQYRGDRNLVHCCQLFFLPSVAWIFLVGAMTISHDWPL